MNLIDKNKQKILALCEKHHVAKLYIFGSVLTDKFNKSSDIDLIVDFSQVGLDQYADNYFEFKSSLEKLLKRDVDLLEEQAIRNPYLRRSIDSSRKLIYGK